MLQLFLLGLLNFSAGEFPLGEFPLREFLRGLSMRGANFRGIVQLVERRSPKPDVEGSSPSAPVIETG